jgi:hypothetical protein
MAWRQGRALNGDAVVFYGVEIFMSFSSIWDVCVVVECRMIVWQGSYQVKCIRRKSCSGTTKG